MIRLDYKISVKHDLEGNWVRLEDVADLTRKLLLGQESGRARALLGTLLSALDSAAHTPIDVPRAEIKGLIGQDEID